MTGLRTRRAVPRACLRNARFRRCLPRRCRADPDLHPGALDPGLVEQPSAPPHQPRFLSVMTATTDAGTSEVHERCTGGTCEVHRCRPPRGRPERTSAHVVAETGDTRQEAFAFQYPQRLAAGLPRMSMLPAEAGDGRRRLARLRCSVADLLADQRCQTSVHPRVCQIQISRGHGSLSLRARGFPRIVAYGRPAQPRLAGDSSRTPPTCPAAQSRGLARRRTDACARQEVLPSRTRRKPLTQPPGQGFPVPDAEHDLGWPPKRRAGRDDLQQRRRVQPLGRQPRLIVRREVRVLLLGGKHLEHDTADREGHALRGRHRPNHRSSNRPGRRASWP